MLCADKFPVSSSSSLSSSSKFVTTIFTKPLFGHFQPLNSRWVSPPLTCFPSKTPPLPTTPSFTNKNKNNTLSLIIKSLRLSNDLEQTLDSLFVENHNIMTSSTKITVIIREQRNWERIVRVFKWFKYQEGYVHNVIHYNVVLRALGRAHKWDILRLCWIDMAKNNVLPTNTTYSTLVDCYAKAGRAKEALLWIKDMRMRGFFIDEVTMSTVVKVLKDIGEFDRADRFYKNWCSGKVDLDDLDFDSSSSLVPIGFKTGELFKIDGGIRDSNAMSSMHMENVGPQKPQDPTTYNTIIDLYGKAGRLNDVAGVFDDMMKSGVAVDTCTFNTMIYIYGSYGNLLEVESLLLKMAEKGVSPNTATYNVLLSLYANAGNIDAALSCYRMIREDGLFPDGITYRALLGVLCTENMVQAVEDVIEDMKKSSVSLDEHSLECIVKMYVNEGDHDKANDLLQKFTTNRGKYVRNNVN
ncbi:pentatricopeptide repeat-containing protein [Trifolium repens]|nr:pentatricopeptide repeat-containing protein [Trifolium repens]